VRDPRLRLAVVTTALQVLGQTVLGFKVSIAQIVVSIAVCAAVELAVTYRRKHVLTWPASAILTGNSIALLLRATGTQHGDWWSLNGIQFFVLAALVGILSKYLVRPGGRHVFNPSNLGLVVCLLLAGPARVFPQPLWWGPMEVPVMLAWIVILMGGAWVLWSLRMAPMVAGFVVTFIVLIAAFAAQGQCFFAVWRATPVCGANYWLGIAASPELAVFVLLMMSDPKTSPAAARGRALYGAATAVVAAALIYIQPSEWGIKLALLASLTIVCAAIGLATWMRRREPAPAHARPGSGLAAMAALVVALVVPVAVVADAESQQVLQVDRPPATGTPGLQ
jgi:hypothetical protein